MTSPDEPLVSLPLRADWEQALIRARWPEGVPYRYRKGSETYADQYAELLAAAMTEAVTDEVSPPAQNAAPLAEVRWACVYCRSSGRADNPEHAVALTGTHWAWACPATATVYDDQPLPFVDKLGRLHFADGPGDGYVQRVARHQHMHRLYPELVPEWTGGFRG